jgi:proline dehydrogenase
MILIYLSCASWARKIVQNWGIAQRTSARFVAGETLDQAVTVVRALSKKGIFATLDHLGENVSSSSEADRAADEILGIIDRLDEEGLPSGVSVKLSQIGLATDEDVCERNLTRILERAKNRGIFVRVDMEDSQLTQVTLEVSSRIRMGGYEKYCGVAVQAYLYRTVDDVRNLLEDDTPIRLCKGAYKEPRSVAFPSKKDVDSNFDRITQLLLNRSLEVDSRLGSGGKFPPIPAIATHDPERINHAIDYAKEIGLSNQNLEFQMLYGIRPDLQEQLRDQGYPVRVYVPYGTEWYPYFVRRLAERPANLWFFISNLMRGE